MMRWIFAVWFVLAGVAHAQPLMMGILGGGGAAYVGPGDIVSGAIGWYGLRGYSAAYAASGAGKAVNIRRASDNSTIDIVILNNGNFDSATAATFCAATTCFVTEWYDQSGSGRHATQSTAGNQAQLVFAALNSNAVLYSGSAVNVFYAISGGCLGNIPYSVAMVGNRTGQFTTEGDAINCGNYSLAFYSSANQIFFGVPGAVATAADNTWHSIQSVAQSSYYLLNVDGSSTSGSASFSSGSLYSSLWNNSGRTSTDYFSEIGVWSVAFNSTQYSALHKNQSTYWGTP